MKVAPDLSDSDKEDIAAVILRPKVAHTLTLWEVLSLGGESLLSRVVLTALWFATQQSHDHKPCKALTGARWGGLVERP